MTQRRSRPAKNGVDAGEQLIKLEWLGNVIIGAEIQAADAIRFLPASRDHQDWSRRMPPQLRADVKTVHPRQHHVEHDEVWSKVMNLGQRRTTISHEIDFEPLKNKILPHDRRQVHVVFDD